MDITLASGPNLDVTLAGAATPIVLNDATAALMLSLGVPGLAGPKGAPGSGAGVTYIQDNEPLVAIEGEIWFLPTTQQLRVFSGGWKPLYLDGGYF